MRGYGPLFYFFEAVRGLRANSLVNLLAMGTISMAMLIVGFCLVIFLNLQNAVNAMGERLELTVFLKDGLSAQEQEYLKTKLKSEPAVKKITFISKADALARLRLDLKGQEHLLDGLQENPLPDSYEVAVDKAYADTSHMDTLTAKIGKFSGVEDVTYGKQGVEVLNRLLAVVTYGGTAMAVLLGVTVVFIVSNSVRLALYSRGQEIELMQWIGATRWFIMGPFLVEGMLVASLGTAVAVAILAALFHSMPHEAAALFAGPGGIEFLPGWIAAYLIGGGGILGLLGALVSVNKFLE